MKTENYTSGSSYRSGMATQSQKQSMLEKFITWFRNFLDNAE